MEVHPNEWFIMGNAIKMDDLGVPPVSGNFQMFWISPCVQTSANKGLQGTVKHCKVCLESFTATYDRQLSENEG